MSIPLSIHRVLIRRLAIAGSLLVLNSLATTVQASTVSDLAEKQKPAARAAMVEQLPNPKLVPLAPLTPTESGYPTDQLRFERIPHEQAVPDSQTAAAQTAGAMASELSVDEWSSLLLAQNLAGQCRQTRRIERIYNNADLAAARLRDVPAGTRLTLAGPVNQPDFGWIRISQPVNGFILTAFLVPCFSTPAPPPVPPPSPPTGPVIGCGIAQANLAINTQPNTQAFTIGGISPGQGFRITGTRVTQTVPPIERGRIWTPIERFGIRGWISETGPGGFGQNLRLVPCASIGL